MQRKQYWAPPTPSGVRSDCQYPDDNANMMPNSREGRRDLEYLSDRSPTAREPQLRKAALKQTERRAARHSFVRRTRGADFILHLRSCQRRPTTPPPAAWSSSSSSPSSIYIQHRTRISSDWRGTLIGFWEEADYRVRLYRYVIAVWADK